jgi:hypothetical protein
MSFFNVAPEKQARFLENGKIISQNCPLFHKLFL